MIPKPNENNEYIKTSVSDDLGETALLFKKILWIYGISY